MRNKVFTERYRALRGSRQGSNTRVTDHQEIGPKRNRSSAQARGGPAPVRASSFPPKRDLDYTPFRWTRTAVRQDAGRHLAERYAAGNPCRTTDAGAVAHEGSRSRGAGAFKRGFRAGKVVRRRGVAGRPADGARAALRAGGALGTFILAHRSTLLWLSFILIIGASLIPVYVNVRSLLWERTGNVEKEGEALYNLFLDEGVGGSGTVIVWGEEESSASRTAGPADRSPADKSPKDLSPTAVVPVLTVSKYEVKQGDSLYGIANRHGVPVDAVLSANELPNPRYLKVGTVLRVPNMGGVFYRVKGGDSLYGIAHRYRVPVTGIVDVNDLASEVIHPGQELFLPGASLSEWERASALGTLFESPARGRFTSKVGFRIDPFTGKMAYHAGVDFANETGAPVRAAQYGRVSFVGYYGNYGKTVIIRHPDSYTTLYAHLDKILVKKGQAVRQEEKIGFLGNTGRSTGPHLHFEVHRNGKVVDPMKVIKLR